MAKIMVNGNGIGVIGYGSGVAPTSPFIASTGFQYIALPFYSDEAITLEFDLLQCDYKIEGVILGDIFDYAGVVLYTNGDYNQIRMTTSQDIAYTAPKWKWSHIEMDLTSGTMSADGVTIFNSYEAHGHNQQYLFGLNGRNAVCGIKNFKVYKNDTLFLDFTPMRDAQTGEGYFHDEVSGNDYYGNNPLIYSEV